MKKVSAVGEGLFTQLVAWEFLGDVGVSPKRLLRGASMEDLQIVLANAHEDPKVRGFMVVKMIEAEVMFREGMLQGDWKVSRQGNHANLSYAPAKVGGAIPSFLLTIHEAGVLA